MKRHLILLAALVAPIMLCNAQKADNNASALTEAQASQVAKILLQHNVMMEYCGCCEVAAKSCVQILKVTHDSVSVTVNGVNLENGEKYVKKIDVAEAWVPQLTSGAISKMQCVGQLAKINCDPCTNPSVPSGEVGKKMLALELDGLMEASGSKATKDGRYDVKNPNRDLDSAKKIRALKGDNLSKPLKKEVQKLTRDGAPVKRIPKNAEN